MRVFSLAFLFAVIVSKTVSADPNAQCISCHQQSHQQWQASDHARAMAPATAASVLADFNNTTISHHDLSARFYKTAETFMVDISEGQPAPQSFAVKYTFGHYPLQQYLVATTPDKLQVLPFSWDSRPAAEGGQRWYPNYADDNILPNDRLHWRQPLQNWNGMCADCHSDGLQRNYSPATNTFDSQWTNINVGCVSCHTMQPEHGDSNAAHAQDKAVTPSAKQALLQDIGQWLREPDAPTASWQGPKIDNQFMDTCFSCHSLRSPLTDGISPNSAFLDQFTPQWIQPPLYHADGQIREEVYVYGSFLQSKMYTAGVNCLDCHDPHTMKVKAQTNALCAQCHNPTTFDTPEHHGHPIDTQGAQCVNCHMPETTYMGVDKRRDHSFKIPRPQLTEALGTPNACNGCHEDKSAKWAANSIEKWHGESVPVGQNALNIYRLMAGDLITPAALLQAIQDNTVAPFLRASALAQAEQLGYPLEPALLDYVSAHENELLRLSAVQALQHQSAAIKMRYLPARLSDEVKAVRAAAARSLIDTKLSAADKAAFDQAFEEMLTGLLQSSWRGEGRANLAMMYQQAGDPEQARQQLEHGIIVDPYFAANYIALAEWHRAHNATGSEQNTLEQGLAALPKSADLHYAYGLYLVRQKQPTAAVDALKKAVRYAPDNAQFIYTYVLSMHNIGQSKQALSVLKRVIDRFDGNQQLLELGLYLAQQLNDRDSYVELINR